eukprot:Pompholyxophrys_punicea_v1_NODE_82_length_3700_cov_3.100110.p2 type:complete len:114 gc:universal NODE_82_length_3700_cov_3.100110:3657-3316(-)
MGNCCLCQKKGDTKDLKCPLDSKANNSEQSYLQLCEQIEKLKQENCLALVLGFTPQWLLEKTITDFIENRAMWHKSCRLKFSWSKVSRVIPKIEIVNPKPPSTQNMTSDFSSR